MNEQQYLTAMRQTLTDLLTMPEYDGTIATSTTRANIKRRARALLREVEKTEEDKA